MHAYIPIIAAALSILAVAALARLIRKTAFAKICPLCAGVAGTWLWILAGIYFGWLESEGWKLAAAIAMGGSVVGILYQIEKNAGKEDELSLFWKVLFAVIGFIAAYFILLFSARPALIALLALLAAGLKLFFPAPARLLRSAGDEKAAGPEQTRRVEALKKKMKNCC